jgi:hypothetical protein
MGSSQNLSKIPRQGGSRKAERGFRRGRKAYGAYQGVGLKAVGFNLDEFAGQVTFCQHDAEQLAQFARRANLGTFLHAARRKVTLKYAQDASIQFLSGPAIAPACSEPRGMWRLPWGDVLAKPEIEL